MKNKEIDKLEARGFLRTRITLPQKISINVGFYFVLAQKP
jgi:hypothetical protein